MKSSRNILTFIVILFAFTAVFFSFERNQKLLVSWFDGFGGKEKELVETSFFMGGNLTYHNGRYLSWNGERISCLDNRGEVLWSRTFLIEQPQFRFSEGRIGVFSNEGEVYVYNMDGKPKIELKLEDPVFDVYILDSELVVHTKPEGKEILTIYGGEGETIDIRVFEGESPVACWRDSKGSLNISVIRLNQSGITSKLINDTAEEPILTMEGVVILTTYPYASSTLVLTDEGVKLYKKGKQIWDREYPLIKDLIIDGEDIYVLYGDNLEILDGDGKTIAKQTNSIDFKKLHIHGRYVIMYGKRDIQVLRDGETVVDYSTGGRIEGIKSQFNDLIVIMEEGVSIMRIKDIEVKEEDNK
jgi:hypothetical protein